MTWPKDFVKACDYPFQAFLCWLGSFPWLRQAPCLCGGILSLFKEARFMCRCLIDEPSAGGFRFHPAHGEP